MNLLAQKVRAGYKKTISLNRTEPLNKPEIEFSGIDLSSLKAGGDPDDIALLPYSR